jgi:hypothetical protein
MHPPAKVSGLGELMEKLIESDSQVVIYKAPGGSISLEVKLQGESVWLDTHQMARLFDRDRTVIVRHIRNIYQTKELDRASTSAKNARVAADGKVRPMDFYNLCKKGHKKGSGLQCLNFGAAH